MKKIILLLVISFFTSVTIQSEEIDRINDLAINGIPIIGIDFSDSGEVGVCWGLDGSIWKTVNKNNWEPAISLCLVPLINVEAVNISTFIAVTNSHVLITRNGGVGIWSDFSHKFPTGTVFTKVRYDNHCIYILGEQGKVFRSLDFGETWNDISLPAPSQTVDVAFFDYVDSGYLITSDPLFPFWKTTNGGQTWTGQTIQQNMIGSCIAVSGKFVFIGGLGDMGGEQPGPMLGRFDEAAGWIITPLPESYSILGVNFQDANGFLLARKSSSLLARTSSFGIVWSFQEVDRAFYASAINGGWIYTTGDSGTIYRNQFQVTGISGVNSEIPSNYSLSQNYPNPFNPTTKINFSIPTSGNVKLIVYNTVGEEVTVLLNQSLNVGNYVVDFDATHLTSGVYFYTLQAESFTETKKMVLLK
jgi:photosystem II stability/assembly factor-like uncharacterized protein